ncbi:MAG TPA: LysR family transcriptional regulator [Steroidobacteraceae bacterium]|nr:LysR family transcriptional regulator [Steroidobacteraceae bacterium]
MGDLNALMIFATVAKAKSFSEAARRLKMPLASVSRRVAELEDQLGMRLLERSTRNLRLTEIGAEVLEHAQRSIEISEAIDSIVSNHRETVSGLLRISAPPNISDSLLAPLLCAFRVSYPNVRIQALITERHIDHIADGVDLAFRVGVLKDASLVARKLLTYRHRLVASPEYLRRVKAPQSPADLLAHPMITFSYWKPETSFTFVHVDTGARETVTFLPYLSMNDFAGLTPALLAGEGIGDLPPVVQPDLVRDGRLIEVMPAWRFPTFDLSLVHLSNRLVPRPVRVFKEFAVQMAPKVFPDLPT